MSTPKIPDPGLLIISVLSAKWDAFWPGLLSELEGRFGKAEPSELFAFDQTDYYDKELGTPITRRIVAFDTLRPLDELADIKLFTNGLEARYAVEGKRLFNLDPGFITMQSLVLATGKNFSHRIYLKDGIWADLTLIWQKKQWVDFPWTFPDYAGEAMKTRLTKLRQSYRTKQSKPQT
ncbi:MULTISPECIES: DUF4416 family protein [unclassified Pseudodesulfovibrio]|uniref:DUF4416 family protein n=1 Tax=unclassified Pseudodesulfovibrio TaxID=2661612 RepID=UPI000FEB8ABD|nr:MULTISPECIES: DUF4416 family protein [unclassified Pseudodesulfovibrio]MCJ2162987.1 DUF4416 family protein [Pseudodesulfovibrio sp. S3-i]RWU06984.1 DUF4416 family protein [Pseudodesulfovibrio sp. S3]